MMTKHNDNSNNVFIKELFENEHNEIESLLAELFGYHIVQLGTLVKQQLLKASPIRHQVCVSQSHHANDIAKIIGFYHELPLLNDSVDVILAPHVLHPDLPCEAIIAELWRSLMPQGHAIFLGFNKLSFWNGICFGRSQIRLLQNNDVMNPNQLRNLLRKQGFEIILVKTFFYCLPSLKSKWWQRLRFLERVGRFLIPMRGSVYVIFAKKKVVALTPIRPRWQLETVVKSKPVVEPSRRNYNRE